MLVLEADHRRHAEIANAIRDLNYGVGAEPSPLGQASPPTGSWLAVQTMAHNLARWTAPTGLGERLATTKTLHWMFFSMAEQLTRSAPHDDPAIFWLRWPWAVYFSRALT